MNKVQPLAFPRATLVANENSAKVFADLEIYLPSGVRFDDDVWPIQSWQRVVRRGGTLNLFFDQIRHRQLRSAIKCLALYRRKTGKSISGRSMPQLIRAAAVLGDVLQARPIRNMTTADVLVASERLCQDVPAYTLQLAMIVAHFNAHYGLNISYRPPRMAGPAHGTMGNDIARATKLISDQVLMELLALNFRKNLDEDDRLLVSAIALNITCGWRVSELVTLPLNCLVEDEGALFVCGYPSKNGKLAPKLIPSVAIPLVKSAYEFVRKVTDEGRGILAAWIASDEPDWSEVVKDGKALRYFAQKSLHEWGMRPENRLINPDAAWHRDRGWIDVLSELELHPHRHAAGVAP